MPTYRQVYALSSNPSSPYKKSPVASPAEHKLEREVYAQIRAQRRADEASREAAHVRKLAQDAEHARWAATEVEQHEKSKKREERWLVRLQDEERAGRHAQLKRSFKESMHTHQEKDRIRERDGWTSPIAKDSKLVKAANALKNRQSPVKKALKHATTQQLMKQQLKQLRDAM